jgi:2-dehydropantoate 2-reductase
MRVTIIGTGAMACLLGAHFASVSLKGVTLVGTWTEGLKTLNAEGITLTDAHGTRNYRVDVARLGSVAAPAEVVLVLVKSWQTETIAPHLDRLVAPDGAVVTLQNGLGNVEKLGPRAHLGVTALGAVMMRTGHVRLISDGPTILAAPPWAVEVFQHAGLDTQAVEAAQAQEGLWGRLVANCAIGPLTAILRVPNGELLARQDAALLLDRAAVECAMVAWSQGIRLPFNEPIAHVRETVERTALNQSSMLQDVRRGAPTEVDAFNGAVVREGYRLGITTTINEALWRMVRALAAAKPAK